MKSYLLREVHMLRTTYHVSYLSPGMFNISHTLLKMAHASSKIFYEMKNLTQIFFLFLRFIL